MRGRSPLIALLLATASCARCVTPDDAPDARAPTDAGSDVARAVPASTLPSLQRGDAALPIMSALARSIPGSRSVTITLRTRAVGCDDDAGLAEDDLELTLAPMLLLATDAGYHAASANVWHVVRTTPPSREREGRDLGTARVPKELAKTGARNRLELSLEAALTSSACFEDGGCTKVGFDGGLDVLGCGEGALEDAGGPRPQGALKLVIGGEPITIRGAVYREERQQTLLGASKILELSTEPLACDGPRLPADVHFTIISNAAYAKFYFDSLRLPQGTFFSTPLDLDVPKHVEEGGQRVVIGFKDNTDFETKRGFPMVIGGKVTAIHCGHETHEHSHQDASAH